MDDKKTCKFCKDWKEMEGTEKDGKVKDCKEILVLFIVIHLNKITYYEIKVYLSRFGDRSPDAFPVCL